LFDATVAGEERVVALRLEMEELDHLAVISQKHMTFLAAIAKNDATCGWLEDYYHPACFYCIGPTCDSIERDDPLYMHWEHDDVGCFNKMRVLTNRNDNGECGPWIDRIAMINTTSTTA